MVAWAALVPPNLLPGLRVRETRLAGDDDGRNRRRGAARSRLVIAWHLSKRETQIILMTDERKVILELGVGGKFAAKSTGWDENRVFLEGDKTEAAVKNGRRVLTHLPAGPRPAVEPVKAQLRHGRVTVSLRSDGVTATLEHRCVTLSPVAVETGNGVDDEWSASKARAELVDVAAGERAISAIAVSMLTHTLSPTRCGFPSWRAVRQT